MRRTVRNGDRLLFDMSPFSESHDLVAIRRDLARGVAAVHHQTRMLDDGIPVVGRMVGGDHDAVCVREGFGVHSRHAGELFKPLSAVTCGSCQLTRAPLSQSSLMMSKAGDSRTSSMSRL